MDHGGDSAPRESYGEETKTVTDLGGAVNRLLLFNHAGSLSCVVKASVHARPGAGGTTNEVFFESALNTIRR